MQLNQAARELTIKIVYYGPGLSGKTTNLQVIHSRLKAEVRGKLMTTDTADDRTLFFDLLPVYFSTARGFKVKVKVFTVPGQVIHNTTRRIVLKDADAVAFIADARRAAGPDNNAYWKNLKENMKENGLEGIPTVIQYNKRDLPDTKSEAELEETRKRGKEVIVGASAIRGEGVLETFHAVLSQAFRSLDARASLAKSVGLTEEEFLGQVFANIDLRGTALEKQYAAGA